MSLRHMRIVAVDPPALTIDDCTCLRNCGTCELSGRQHTHPEDVTGDYGPCPLHRDSPLVAQ